MDKNGFKEGVARSISQACVYGMEAHKTLMQVHGHIPKMPWNVLVQRWTTGMLTSSMTSGIVFGTYFSVYNRLDGHIMAGTIASVATSVIKIPISNGMRLMQSGGARSLCSATRKIVRCHSWKGLYTGYPLSIMEDIIEFDLRARIYRALKTVPKPWWCEWEHANAISGFAYGAISGAVASGVTTPFDTIRSHLAVNAGNLSKSHHAIDIARGIIQHAGVHGLYRGVAMRVMSNTVKSALFFTVFELLP